MDNEVGRFISLEPVMMILHDGAQLKKMSGQELQNLLSDPQALNYYSYSRNNPVILVDPDGNWWKEFFTGQQSWSSFQLELGQAAQQLYNDSGVARAVMNNPYTSGAAIGVGSGLVAWGASAGITTGLTQLGILGNQVDKVDDKIGLTQRYGSEFVDKLNTSGFRPTQDYINVNKVNEYVRDLVSGNKLEPIEVMKNNGIRYITDGHHRFIASKITDVKINFIQETGPLVGTSWYKVQTILKYIDKY